MRPRGKYLDLISLAKLYRQYGHLTRTPVKVGRNDPCSCGSGRKYKKCCEKL
ncbi:MAG: SEC-C metal-binding domain-containing protein [Candidatus Heimdallarchaeaceae archaeon]